jgi:DNA primase
MIRTPLAIRTSIACLELVTWEKHKRYCLEQWQKLNMTTDYKRHQYYVKQIIEAHRHVQKLQQMRQINIFDIHKFAPII